MTTPPTIDTMHDPEALDVLSRSVDHVLGRHLGAMLGSDEAAVLLDHLEAQGYTLTPVGETQHSPVTETLYGEYLQPDIRVMVNLNVEIPVSMHGDAITHRVVDAFAAAEIAANHTASPTTDPRDAPRGVGESTS